ncbi:tryptophan synthase subunit alpha [Traorella massiliensis]|uniref:tryptophan synthase subunit alpha n=1 Tax=Traorella massiliensis TaxID=1903263 RepID=UPI002357BACC|nr:tryptophan synthase subunit alpha [Traorella massiliensis]
MKFIGYIPFGYPSIEQSIISIENYVSAGCEAVEISFPLYDPIGESDLIVDFMRKALKNCSDYAVYMKAVQQVRKNHPSLEINLLLFTQVMQEIGFDCLISFYDKCKINSVICPDVNDHLDVRDILTSRGMKFVAPFHYDVNESELKNCLDSKGFVYMQAFPPSWQKVKKGYETPDKIVDYLRKNGVKQEIYAGVGIKTLEDVETIKKAGVDGFFVGSSLMKLLDDPIQLHRKITEFINAGK